MGKIRRLFPHRGKGAHKPLKPLPSIDINDLQKRTFLQLVKEDGSRHHAKIIKVYEDNMRDNAQHPKMTKLN